MTTHITLDFDSMDDDNAQKLAAVIEFYVSHNFPQSLLHGATVTHTKKPVLKVAGVSSAFGTESASSMAADSFCEVSPPEMNDDGELVPGHVVIGMGVTERIGSDSYPGTVSRASETQKTIWFVRDEYKRTDDNGYGGTQEYEYRARPIAYNHEGLATNEHMARWSNAKQRYVVSGGRTALSKGRRAYFDPSF